MELTIAENLIVNREKRRRSLLSQKENKPLKQIADEEGKGRFMQQLSNLLSGNTTTASTEKSRHIPPKSPTGSSGNPPESPQKSTTGSHECITKEITLIRILLERLVNEFSSFSGDVKTNRFPLQETAPETPRQRKKSPEQGKAHDEDIPVVDIADFADNVQGID